MHTAQDHLPTLAVVDLHHAGQKLGDLHAVFADPGAHLEDIASSMKTLCKMFERLRISLQQTNKPFEGYDGFDRTLRNCELFVQSFRPAKPGKPWTCTTEDVSKLEAQIMMQIALLSTTNIVLLAETFYGGESGTIDEITQLAFLDADHSIDDEVSELWNKIQRLIYRRKRKPAPPEARHNLESAMNFEGLEKEVQSQVRQLMLNHHPSLPGIRSNQATSHYSLNLDSLPDDKLLERTQQQQRSLLSATRRATPRPTWIERRPSKSVSSRSNTLQEELDPTEQGKRIPRSGTILFKLSSRPYRFDLGKLEAKVIDKKRMIYGTSTDGDIFITHDLPTKFKRHLNTNHPKIGSPSEVYFSETLHVEVRSRFEKIVRGDAYIYYTFTEPGALRQFQEMVRDKDLLHTFCISKIVSANGEEVSYQHLKVWRDRQTQSCTLSFLRNVASNDQTYVEFPLSALSLNSAKQPKDSRTVRLGFIAEYSSSSSPPQGLSLETMPFARSNRRLSGASLRTDATNTTIRQTEKLRSLAASMAFLLIKFTYGRDIDTFCSTLTHLQSDPPSPMPRPTNTPPLAQGGIFSALHEGELGPRQFLSSSPTSMSVVTSVASPRHTHQDYAVGWIAALPIELQAAIAMLDEQHAKLPQHSRDNNTYVLGRIANHNVVMACLPAGSLGNNSATSVATQMAFTFPNISIRLMVGIGGGVPGGKHDIRLGDVVVSKPGRHDGGVVQYDFGKTTGGGFERTGSLPSPPARLLTVISLLEALHNNENDALRHLHVFEERADLSSLFRYPGAEQDQLFRSEYDHVAGQPTCASCDPDQLVRRPPRECRTRIHFGTIASGNQVMRDARTRDALRLKYDVLCFEMEAAGLMHLNTFPCVVIRGICDYSDTHKNKEWQSYAAAVAVAFARELLENISQVYETDSRVFHDERNRYSIS